ncbi:MAG: class I SAM-dependent methyltransferase [Candidatus Obscuribacterales bacterium]|nr:class I SAM-dependent methyltransferase [Candidatus Obscuribacterales bacterium]
MIQVWAFTVDLFQKLKNKFSRANYRPARDFLLSYFPPNSVGAEIGVWRGDFSSRILEVVRPAKLHLIDPWLYETDGIYKQALYGGDERNQDMLDDIYNQVQKRFNAQIKTEQVLIHRSSSETAASIFDDNYFDWIYIDGNHLYECVKKDLHRYLPKVKQGGYITGDDYANKNAWWQNGVEKAVDEFIESGYCTKLEIRDHQFILQKQN